MRYSIFLVLIISLTACATPPNSNGVVSGQFSISPLFSQFYESHGGAGVLGVPLSNEINEGGITVQYFQNAKLEYYPQLPGDHQVILASLGQTYFGLAPCISAASAGDALYFNNCHSVDPAFRDYFESQGGLAFFGYPISERYISQGRMLAQNFERATIIWESSLPAQNKFGLLPLGAAVCPPAACAADVRSALVVLPPPATPTVPAQTDPLTAFYLNYGGSRVFGKNIGSPQLGEDGAREQVYENAVLFEDPSTPVGVALRPLGLNLLGRAEPPVVPMNGPNTGYFAKYGHNIAYTVFDFYKANGGEVVFGQPITELQTANSFFVQYFEKAVFTVHFNLPPDQIVQLMPLGRQSFGIQTVTPRTAPPQLLVLRTQPAQKMFDPLVGQQTLTVQVLDENALPVAGAQAHFVVYTPAGDMEFVGATGADGYATYTFGLTSFNPGKYMLYDVRVEYGSLQNTAADSFVTWGPPLP